MENILMCKAEKEDIYSCADIISKEHAWKVYGFDLKKSMQVLETMEDVFNFDHNRSNEKLNSSSN